MSTTSGLVIRAAGASDAHMLAQIYAPYVRETAITFEYEIPTAGEFAQRIAHVRERYPYLVAELDGAVVGYAYAGVLKSRAAYDWSCETSIYVAQDAHSRGVGRRLYQELEAALGGMGITNLYACISYAPQPDEYLDNASIAFHGKMGYRIVGHFHACGYKFGRWYDVVWMEKRLKEQDGCPAPIAPYAP